MLTLTGMSAMNPAKRIHLGPPWDDLFGGGLVPGSVTLLCGLSGAGKSTLAMQLAALVAKARRKSATYVNNGAAHVATLAGRLRVSDRLALSPLGSSDQWSGSALVLDALPDFIDAPDQAELVRIVKGWAVKRSAPAIIVTGMTKSGDVAGPIGIQHSADVLVSVEFPERGDVGHKLDDERKVQVWKCRYGPLTIDRPLWLRMTDRGLVPMTATRSSAVPPLLQCSFVGADGVPDPSYATKASSDRARHTGSKPYCADHEPPRTKARGTTPYNNSHKVGLAERTRMGKRP